MKELGGFMGNNESWAWKRQWNDVRELQGKTWTEIKALLESGTVPQRCKESEVCLWSIKCWV